MRLAFLLLLLGSCVGLVVAQEPKPQPKPADKTPAKADKAEPVAGRKLKKIEGFTFLISDEALEADASGYERKPLEVLEYECKMLSKALSPKAVELLRKLTIWVDWDEQVPNYPGREGFWVATYYSGSAAQAPKDGRHPLQAKTVTIHSLKSMTRSHQPKNDARNDSLLLHEFAHAVHDQLLSYDHAGVRAAYEQAIERRLYDKDSYAIINHREFFAEMSCAYLDRLSYYPHTRADLKKHDPVTYQTLEKVWAGAAGRVAKEPAAGAATAALDVTFPAGVRLGELVAGPKLDADRVRGKLVLVAGWGSSHSAVLTRLDRLQAELGDYGLVTVGVFSYNQPAEVIQAKAKDRTERVTVIRNASVKEGTRMEPLSGGQALLFDPAGKCVYRGRAHDVDEPLRAAVGKLLLTSALGSGEVPKAFKSVDEAFAAGAGPVAVFPKVLPLTRSSDADTKEKATKLQDLILAPGQRALADASAKAKTDPVAAFIAAERVAAVYKNTPLAPKANSLIGTLRTDKAVAGELRARVVAADIEKIANQLRVQKGGYNPTDPEFQKKNQQALAQMRTLLEQLRKTYPNAPATAGAEKTAREFGVP
jgi:hypothetical protein